VVSTRRPEQVCSKHTECLTAGDRIASDALLVELENIREIAADVCSTVSAP
jgi:hypothetical protein